MKNIICCLRLKESYVRIKNPFVDNKGLNFENFVFDLEELKELAVYKKWDIAVVDKNLSFFGEAIRILKTKDTDIIFFEGDYKEVIDNLRSKIGEIPEEDKEEEIEDTAQKDAGIRYIEKPVTKLVEKKIYTSIERKIVLIAGLTRGSGSTTLTLNIASYLSDLGILSAVVEPPIKPSIFNWIGISALKDEESFYSYPHKIVDNENIESNREFILDNIIYIVPDDRKEKIKEWGFNEMMKLVYSSNKAPIILVDIGSNISHESISSFLPMADLLIFIIDPFPSSVAVNSYMLDYVKSLGEDKTIPVSFVINKFNNGFDKKDFLKSFGIKPTAFIPAIDLSLLYKANYENKIPFSYNEFKEVTGSAIAGICSLFIPKGFSGSNITKDSKSKPVPLVTILEKIKRKFKKIIFKEN